MIDSLQNHSNKHVVNENVCSVNDDLLIPPHSSSSSFRPAELSDENTRSHTFTASLTESLWFGVQFPDCVVRLELCEVVPGAFAAFVSPQKKRLTQKYRIHYYTPSPPEQLK